ncbi:MAG: porin [Xanthomonadaceae bacterium]|nr:porin [Xanthomonadaceae bacterium]
MNALFQYESGVDLTGQGENDGNGPGSTSGLFTAARDSFIGVSGEYGTLLVGKLGGLNQWVYDYNLFADQVGDLGNLWGGTGLPGRLRDTLHYRTPAFNGLSAALSYTPDEDNSTSKDVYLIKIDHDAGALKLGGAYANLDQTTGKEWQVLALTGSYDFGEFTVGGGWQNESDIGGVAGNDRDSFTIGVSMKLGAMGTFKAQYTNSDADAANSDASQWALGYDHSVNQYMTVYLAYTATDNESAVAFTANNYGKGDTVTPAIGQDPSVISVGLIILFDAAMLPR